MVKQTFINSLTKTAKVSQDYRTVTILFALGAYGAYVAQLFQAQKNQQKTVVYLFKAQPERKKGLVVQSRFETAHIWLPKPRKTLLATATLWRYLLKLKQAEITALAKKILAKEAKKGGQLNINLCLAANLAETEGSILTTELLTLVSYFTKLLGPKLLKVAFLLLPEALVTQEEAAVYVKKGLLKTVPATLSRVAKEGYDITFLLSTVTAAGLVTTRQTAQLVNEFMQLLLEPKFQAELKERFAGLSTKLATFTLSTLVYPLDWLREQQIKKVVKEVIEQTVVNAEANFHFLATEFCAEENININSWLTALQQAALNLKPTFMAVVGSYPDKNIAAWPQKLANYKAFLLNSSLLKAKQAIKEKAQELLVDWQKLLQQKLDDIMQSPFCFKQAEDFLNGLEQLLATGRQKVVNQLKKPLPAEKRIARLDLRLRERIANFPHFEAVILRLAAFYFLFVFGVQQMLIELKQLPPHLLNPKFLPAPRAAYFAGLSLLLVGWLKFKLDEVKLLKTKDAFIALLERVYQEEIDREAKQTLITLLAQPQDSAVQERFLLLAAAGNQDYSFSLPETFLTLIKEEQKKIKRFKLEYLKLYQALKRQPQMLKATAVRKFILPEGNISYKLGSYQPEQEFELFLAAGGHKDWDQLSRQKLYQRWRNYCLQGLKFYEQLTATEIFLSLTLTQQTELLAQLRNAAYFYLKINSGWPNLTEVLFVNAPNFQDYAHQPKYLTVVPATIDKIVYLKLSYPLTEGLLKLAA